MTTDRENRRLSTMANRTGRKLPRRSQQQLRAAAEEGFARIASGAEPVLGPDDFGAAFTAQMQKAIDEWFADRATQADDRDFQFAEQFIKVWDEWQDSVETRKT